MPFAGSEQHQIVCIMSGMYDMEDEDWSDKSPNFDEDQQSAIDVSHDSY
jgi:hypothetical protein